jgi:hypothetical protein
MQRPSIGRIVLYNHPGSADGKYPPTQSPAIIQERRRGRHGAPLCVWSERGRRALSVELASARGVMSPCKRCGADIELGLLHRPTSFFCETCVDAIVIEWEQGLEEPMQVTPTLEGLDEWAQRRRRSETTPAG